jgi:hypothetical protein
MVQIDAIEEIPKIVPAYLVHCFALLKFVVPSFSKFQFALLFQFHLVIKVSGVEVSC